MALTRERVVLAAVSYADAHGLESLTMRVLASELGAGAMSLYHYISDKNDLVDAMVDLVAEELSEPAPDADWKAVLRASAISLHEVLRAHPWASKVWTTRGSGPAKRRHLELMLRGLRESGFSEELTCRGFHTVSMHVVGFTLQEVELPFHDRDGLVEIADSVLSDLSEEDFPYFAEHIRHHILKPTERDDFLYVLDLILEGLERDRLSEISESQPRGGE
jgi:AcrR family transcriptional regulator